MDLSLSKQWEIEEDRGVWHAAVHVVAELQHDWATEQEQTKARTQPNSHFSGQECCLHSIYLAPMAMVSAK